MPGKNVGTVYMPRACELPWPVFTAAPIRQGLVALSRYEPKPVTESRGSIMAIAWKGAAIHQSMD